MTKAQRHCHRHYQLLQTHDQSPSSDPFLINILCSEPDTPTQHHQTPVTVGKHSYDITIRHYKSDLFFNLIIQWYKMSHKDKNLRPWKTTTVCLGARNLFNFQTYDTFYLVLVCSLNWILLYLVFNHTLLSSFSPSQMFCVFCMNCSM